VLDAIQFTRAHVLFISMILLFNFTNSTFFEEMMCIGVLSSCGKNSCNAVVCVPRLWLRL